MAGQDGIRVAPARPEDAHFVRDTAVASWGSTMMALHGALVDVTEQDALVAWRGEERVGLLTYRPYPDESSWEVVSLDATVTGVGAGSALLAALRDRARAAGARRIWLITTNDNTTALRFYQRRGLDLVALHRDAMAVARRIKPSIPLEVDGIPLRHELELELLL